MTAGLLPRPVLEARRVVRRFGALAAVDAVSLSLMPNRLHAVIGTNGAGKSTLVNLLSGELPVTSGQVLLDGADVTGWSQPRRAQAGLNRSYQRTNVFLPLTVRENCRLAAQARCQRPWAVWEAAARCAASHAVADDVMARTGLHDVADRLAGTLSHGRKRQLEVAMCLATRPRVLLLDEPLAGMGPEESARMLDLLRTLRADHAVLLVEHDMDAVFAVADEITVMVDGQVLASGRPEAVRVDPRVRRAYLGGHGDDAASDGAGPAGRLATDTTVPHG